MATRRPACKIFQHCNSVLLYSSGDIAAVGLKVGLDNIYFTLNAIVDVLVGQVPVFVIINSVADHFIIRV